MNKIYGTDGNVYETSISNGKEYIPLKNEKEEFAIEELEKIKEEIQGLIDFEESCCGNATLGYECLGVIEDKISELKGE